MSARFPHRPTGSWAPGLQADLSLVAMWAFGLEAFVRGIDYITGDRAGVTEALSVVEAALPLQAWGAIILAGTILFLGGVIFKKHNPIITGSLILMATYMALAAGLFMRMVERGWPWDGFRTPAMFVAVSALYGLYAFSAYLKKSSEHAEKRMRNGEAWI